MNKTQLLEDARKLRDNGVSAQEIENWLTSKGSSLAEIKAVSQYGEDKILRAQQDIKELAQKQSIERPFKVATDVVRELPKNIATAVDVPLNAATLGAWNWVGDKLGLENTKRKIEQQQLVSEEMPWAGRHLYGLANTASEIGGAGASPVLAAIPATTATSRLANIGYGAGLGAALSGTRAGFESNFDPTSVKRGIEFGALVGGAVPAASYAIDDVTNAIKNIRAANKAITKEQFTSYLGDKVKSAKTEAGLRTLGKTKYGEEVKNYASELNDQIKSLETAKKINPNQYIDDDELNAILGNKAYREASKQYGDLINPKQKSIVLTPKERAAFIEAHPIMKPYADTINQFTSLKGKGYIKPGSVAEIDAIKKQATSLLKNPNIDYQTQQALSEVKSASKALLESKVPGLSETSNKMADAIKSGAPDYSRVRGVITNLSAQARNPGLNKLDLGIGGAAVGGLIAGSPTTAAIGGGALLGRYLNDAIRAGAVKNAILGVNPTVTSPEAINQMIKAFGQTGGQ